MKPLLLLACAACFATVMGVAVAQGDQGRSRPAMGGLTNTQKESADKALARAFQEAGLQSCRLMSDQVTRFLVDSNQSAGMLMAAPDNANVRIASASIEIESTRSLSYAGVSYSPYGAAGCGVAYEAVTYWPESCALVASRLSKDMKPMGTLGNRLLTFDGGPTMRMFLMPAGAGCVQIKKEIVF